MNKLLKIAACLAAALTLPVAAFGATAPAPNLTPDQILHPASDTWPTYSGDYSGQRYSPLKLINQQTVKNLSLNYVARLTAGAGGSAILGGLPDGVANPGTISTTASVRGSPIVVNGVIYMSGSNNIWAVDARTGVTLWHYLWRARPGTVTTNKGVGIWGNYLFFETSDDMLLSLDATTGQERWAVPVAPYELQYFGAAAPVIVKNHVIIGIGNDLDEPGFLESFDPETGNLQWKHWNVPMKATDPGADSWKNLDYASHGGAQAWVPGSYDPETNLFIYGTSEPKPAYFAAPRGNGDALFACSTIALDVDTGEMKWYFQSSPGDTHDWDSAQTPVLADITFQGKPRKVLITAARNGYFFVLDRVTGQNLITSKFSDTTNWAASINAKGQPIRNPAKDNLPGGALVSNPNGGAANWYPPAYSQDTGLFYINVTESFAEYYTLESDPRGPLGLGGKQEQGVGSGSGSLKAMDPKTGKIAWRLDYPSGGGATGLLATAGKLLFANDASGNLVARDPANGKPLWHVKLGGGGNPPETYMLDGKQHVMEISGDTIFDFVLN